MVLGSQLFQTEAFLKYRSKQEKVIISFLRDIHIPKREFSVPSNFSLQEKRIILPNENVII